MRVAREVSGDERESEWGGRCGSGFSVGGCMLCIVVVRVLRGDFAGLRYCE